MRAEVIISKVAASETEMYIAIHRIRSADGDKARVSR